MKYILEKNDIWDIFDKNKNQNIYILNSFILMINIIGIIHHISWYESVSFRSSRMRALEPPIGFGWTLVRKSFRWVPSKGRKPTIVCSGIPWRHRIKTGLLGLTCGRRRGRFIGVRFRNLPNVNVSFAQKSTRVVKHPVTGVHNVKGSDGGFHFDHVPCPV